MFSGVWTPAVGHRPRSYPDYGGNHGGGNVKVYYVEVKLHSLDDTDPLGGQGQLEAGVFFLTIEI